MDNKSAAGLRRSAVVERIRLREEWSALKGTENQQPNKDVRKKTQHTTKTQNWTTKVRSAKNVEKTGKENNNMLASEALRGVVALVEVGSETRALALRAALAALGASVMPKWSPLVTHLVWSQGGCRSIRSRARALACKLVSPLWVEACAGSARRLSETSFPAAPRQSDLPSPRTMRHLLKKAEMENISLMDLLSDKDEDEAKQLRLRISTDSEANTSKETSMNTTKDQTDDTIEEAVKSKLTQKERQDLAKAERMAKKILAKCTQNPRVNVGPVKNDAKYRIVLTGLNRAETCRIFEDIRSLGARIQSRVNKMTTHVLLGSCRDDDLERTEFISGIAPNDASNLRNFKEIRKPRTLNALLGAARGCRVLTVKWAVDSIADKRWLHHAGYEVPYLKKISQKARLERMALGKENSEYTFNVFNGMRVFISETASQRDCAVQLLSICGATVTQDLTEVDIILGEERGNVCSKWVFDSIAAGRMRTVRRYKV